MENYYSQQSYPKNKHTYKKGNGDMPVDIIWEDGNATIVIQCDGCDKEYEIFTSDTEGLEVCSFCGHYLEIDSESGETDDEDSWD